MNQSKQAPALMFEHALDAVKGWFEMAALDIQGKFSDNVTFLPYGGRCVHLSPASNDKSPVFATGCTGTQVAVFLLQNAGDPDVTNMAVRGAVSVTSVGTGSGLVATGGYELESTEFASGEGREYTSGKIIRGIAADADPTMGGLLDCYSATAIGGSRDLETQQLAGSRTNAVCGVVSRGQFKNSHGIDVVSFHPVHQMGQN